MNAPGDVTFLCVIGWLLYPFHFYIQFIYRTAKEVLTEDSMEPWIPDVSTLDWVKCQLKNIGSVFNHCFPKKCISYWILSCVWSSFHYFLYTGSIFFNCYAYWISPSTWAPPKLVLNSYMLQVQFSTWMHNITELIYVVHLLIQVLVLSGFDGQNRRLYTHHHWSVWWAD